MYPFFRLAGELLSNRKAPAFSIGDTHVSAFRVWPWDIDPFRELNNGRIMTLLDLGRSGTLQRLGVLQLLKELGWYGTVAGSTVRYRKRITVFQRLQLRTRIVGWDDRFVYFDQALWRNSECCAHAVVRVAVAGGKGIVPTTEVAKAVGFPPESSDLPAWIKAWANAETLRPWPPEF
ncbi:MAG: acyl-CoA thioesterase [Pseudomonadota bacterium]